MMLKVLPEHRFATSGGAVVPFEEGRAWAADRACEGLLLWRVCLKQEVVGVLCPLV